MPELVDRHPEDRPVQRGHPGDGPSLRALLEEEVDLGEMGLDALHELGRERRHHPSGLSPLRQDEAGVGVGQVRLVEDVDRRPAGLATRGHAFTRSMYSPDRVSTFTRSPSPTKSGTCTTTPVSRVAGFSAFVLVSPFVAGFVCVTDRVIEAGRSTEIGTP